jgi:4-hydroxybenzoate polyprenyltransferase
VALARALRPSQWTKNILCFAGVIFSQKLGDVGSLELAFFAFALFCAASSAGYLLNDIKDKRADQLHPKKRNRPIASGALPVPVALATAGGLLALGLIGGWLMSAAFFKIIAAYVVLTQCYNFWLKQLEIVDILAVAAGFVLRTVAGVVAVQAPISSWIFLCAFLLAVLLALGKRRAELAGADAVDSAHRKTLALYTKEFLDQMATAVSAATLMAYCLYTVSPETVEKFKTQGLLYTVPLVTYGLFRYQYLLQVKGEGDDPSKLFLRDKPIFITVLLWLLVCYLVIYTDWLKLGLSG